MKTKTDLTPYLVEIQGKQFITLPGLIAEGHALGVVGIETEFINPTQLDNPVFKATVTLESVGANGQVTYKKFVGYGDANVNNVAKKVTGALIRMSESRSIARALRFACNIPMAALEELDSEDNVISNNKSVKTTVHSANPSVKLASLTSVKATTQTTNQQTPTETPAVARRGFSTKPQPTINTQATVAVNNTVADSDEEEVQF